jgi:glycosyltransferase involved in cell wall biosynthesis
VGLNDLDLTVTPEAYLNSFKFSGCKYLVIWIHHPNINIDKIIFNYPKSTLVALNNSQITTFLNRSKYPIYIIKSFYQSIRSCDLRLTNFIEKEINFGFLGVLRSEKGLHHVASYWRSIVKRYPKSKLHIVGGPTSSAVGDNLYVRKIRKIVGRKYLNTIIFYGRIDDLNQVLPKIDIALLNPFSSTEAYPDSILKFYEYGIPVISGLFNGSSDLLRINSMLQFPNIDPVKAVIKLIQNKNLYADSRTKALEFVNSHKDSEISGMWLDLLLSLKNNDMYRKAYLLSNNDDKKHIFKEKISIFLFRIKYTLNYKMRLYINELFCK